MVEGNKVTTSDETIEVIVDEESSSKIWEPSIGEETLKLLDYLEFPTKDREILQKEAREILAHSAPPYDPEGKETGLIVGYIQSGKTTSFTTVSALASDNDYRLIIIVTGITTNLFNQSNTRLEKDLRIKSRLDRKWQFLSNPKARADIKQRIAKAIQKKSNLPSVGKQTVLITVMKQRTHLNNLIKLLNEVPLEGVPTLIIDDEADQASLNNLVNKGKKSPTYKRMLEIRSFLPCHTFLQYTATPQAPLLINIIDALSPNFAILLTPGPTYTGGKVFFERDFRLIRPIRESEVPSKDQEIIDPPDSLLQAMQIFFLGTAAGLKAGAKDNRSMIIHPSKETMQHANYERWVRDIQTNWSNILQLDNDDPDWKDLIDIFKNAYKDLYGTVEKLDSFENLLEYLPSAVSDTIVTLVNAVEGKTPQPDWEQDYAHIIVGGEILNRGYTIEGLTVTYMPRSKGVGNADTLQQRARWFGYKADYLGYCRVYLTFEQQKIYKDYVIHEENVREQLREHAALGKSLKEWRRAFPLTRSLVPTRRGVMDKEDSRSNYSHNWFEQQWPHISLSAIENNRSVVKEIESKVTFKQEEGRTEMQEHWFAPGLNLKFIYKELLEKFQMADKRDSERFLTLMQQIYGYMQGDAGNSPVCTLYLMSGGRLRKRSLDANGKVPTILQGPTHTSVGGVNYPGDSKFCSEDSITIQIHNLDIAKMKSNDIITSNVPAITVHLPTKMSEDWFTQTDKKVDKKNGDSYWE